MTPFDKIFKPVISNMCLTGCYPQKTNFLYKIWWNILFAVLLLWMMLSLIRMKYMSNVEDIADVIINISCISQPVAGLFTIKIYRNNFEEILNIIKNQFWFNDKYKDDKISHQFYYRILFKISIGYQTICYACLVIWFAEPIIHYSNKFAMEITFPNINFIKDFPYFYLIYFTQAVSVIIGSCVVVLFDIIYVASLGFALIQVDILKQNLRKLTKDVNERVMYENLKICIKHHNVILNLLKNADEIFGLLMLDKLLCDIFCLCCATYLLTLQMNLNLKFLLILAASGSQPFLYCFFGDFVTSMCESIGDEAYVVNWENHSCKRIIFGLSMMILRSHKPVLMNAGGMIIFSLPSYVAFIKLLFSFYVALKHFAN